MYPGSLAFVHSVVCTYDRIYSYTLSFFPLSILTMILILFEQIIQLILHGLDIGDDKRHTRMVFQGVRGEYGLCYLWYREGELRHFIIMHTYILMNV